MVRRAWVLRGFVFAVVVCITAGLALTVAGCSAEGKLATNMPRTGGLWSIKVVSDFKEGEEIPAKHAAASAGGQNISPPISWNPGPAQTREYAVIIEDVNDKVDDLPATQWLVYKIPASVTSLPEGAASNMKFAQGKNHTGAVGYIGPEEKSDEKPHKYYIEVFALSDPVQTPAGADRTTIGKEFEGFVLAKGQLMGYYPQKKK